MVTRVGVPSGDSHTRHFTRTLVAVRYHAFPVFVAGHCWRASRGAGLLLKKKKARAGEKNIVVIHRTHVVYFRLRSSGAREARADARNDLGHHVRPNLSPANWARVSSCQSLVKLYQNIHNVLHPILSHFFKIQKICKVYNSLKIPQNFVDFLQY